jgi:type IV secretory pathway TraG/TraD family ATPase VirD4
MHQRAVLKGLQIAKDIPYRDPDAFLSLVGTDGNGKSAFLPIGDALLSRHILLLGGPGTGKSNMMRHLIRNLRANLTDADVMLVLDPTGEHAAQFCQAGDIVFADDQRASDGTGEAQWNLFAELTDDARLIEDASALCDALFEERIRTAADPYAATGARDLTLALIVYLARQNDPSLRNNETLRGLIDGFDAESMQTILNTLPELRAMGAYLSDPTSRQALSVVAALQQAARAMFQGRFGAAGSLGIRATLRRKGGKVIYLCYDASRGRDTGTVFSSLLDIALAEALTRQENEGSIYLILDDVCALPPLFHLLDALLYGRVKGLRFAVALPGISRLQERYGEAHAQAALDAFGTIVTFRLHDRAARAYVKGLYGRHRVVETFNSSVQVRGVIEQVMDQYIIEDEDLTALQTGESIIATTHYPPFYFRMKPYGG